MLAGLVGAENMVQSGGHPAVVVSFIKVEKQKATRKNLKGKQLVFWNKETATAQEYRYAKYLDQNRYNLLFQEEKLLAEGAFSRISKARSLADQRMYAVKQIELHLGMHQDCKLHSVYR